MQLSVGTAVVALALAATLRGEGAERLATTAYLAAIFTAILLVCQRFLPSAQASKATQAFPAFLRFFLGVATLLCVVAALITQPGAEMLVFLVCFGVIALLVFVQSGALAAFNAVLVRGGATAGATRYAVAIGGSALALAALMPPYAAGPARIAYLAMFFATVLLTISLAAPTRAGLLAKEWYARLATQPDNPAQIRIFARVATYAAIAAAAVLIPASLLPAANAEPLTIAAYASVAVATLCVAMECLRRRE